MVQFRVLFSVNILHISSFDRALLPAVAVLTIASLGPAGTHAEFECTAIVVDDPVASFAEWHQKGSGFAPKAHIVPQVSQRREEPFRVLPANHAAVFREVRPPVKEFIKQVVVPILVERYISRLNRGRLLARTGGAS